MEPWYIATEPFGPWEGEAWRKYAAWVAIPGLRELVSLDSGLCPTLLPEIEREDWAHIVNEDFMLAFFTDLDYLLSRLPPGAPRNLLCVFRNPPEHPSPPRDIGDVKFVGYDVVDVHGDVSALSNCGGFDKAFAKEELAPYGLLSTRERAFEVRDALLRHYPDESHADCHVWAVYRVIERGDSPSDNTMRRTDP